MFLHVLVLGEMLCLFCYRFFTIIMKPDDIEDILRRLESGEISEDESSEMKMK